MTLRLIHVTHEMCENFFGEDGVNKYFTIERGYE